MRIYGAKGGGGSSHTPIEAPETGRSKQIVNIVELLCEGEIEGLVDGFKSIYLDGTKIQNDDGSYNFNNVSGQLNVGTQDQNVLDGYDSSQNEVNVGVEVKKKNGAIVRTVTDERINRLRLTLGVRSLFHQNNQGDTNGTNVTLKIMIGSRQYTHTFDGKYSSQYLESVVFDNLPPVPFNISVERLTDDSDSQRLQNGTIWSSYTEIIDTEFTYPNSAVAGISFDSEYFNSIPTRNYLIKAKKVKVPSNYDPIKRTYTGFWDGSFKIAWTDNPAWEIYDLAPILSKMLGVEISFDKWALYDVARYCDQLVPDGMGGMEPRFTCNVWLTEVKTAYDLLNDFCSVFRAIPVWNGTEVSVIIDRPRDPVWTYTNANVVSGFERSYSARKSRHNAVQVTYSDKTNGYESAIEYVSDDEEIKKHGLNLSQITAFGCTSRGQAHRTGKWILETEKREKETITFTVGREGLMHLPGDIIRVADSHYAGTEIGGRVLAINGREVTLDREISIDNASYFTYINGEATHSTIKIQTVNGKEITLDSTPTGLEIYGVWSLSTKQISSGLYRSISIVENADGTNTITALQHEPQKEAIVDNAAHFVETARTLYKAPQINAVEVSTGYDGKLYINGDISSGDGKLTYDIKITKDGNLYQYKKGLSDPNIELSDLPNGDYSVIIYGKNAKGQIVTEKTQTFTIDRPPAPTGVVVTGGLGQITLEWDWVNEVTQTEIFAAETDNFALAEKIAKVTARTYAHTVKGNKAVRYYWLRHTRGINVGPFYQQQGVKGESAVDLDARLTELNTQLSHNIVNEVFDVAAPARGLELVKTVANLTDKGTKLASSQVYNQADGKLYTWNGTAYSATVAAEDVTGKLSKSKIDTSLISQLTGADNTANLARRLAETAQSNINQEITNRQDAVTAEANNRTKAIQAESTNLTKKIQAEATARVAAVTQLQNVNAQQAQLISAVTTKANNALSGLEEEKTARANGDKAESQAREALTARMSDAESNIATIQRTVATNAQSISEVSQHLNAKFDNIKVGGSNLLRNSKIDYVGNRYSTRFNLAHIPDVGQQVTVTLWGELASDRQAFAVYNTHGFRELTKLIKVRAGVYSATFAWRNPLNGSEEKDNELSTHLNLYAYPSTATSDNTIKQIKLEIGNVATDWTPAPEDVDSAVSAVSAKIDTIQQTLANADSALSSRIDTVTASVGSNLAKITQVSNAVAGVDGKLSSTHTIKTETIAGGRKAIAGIALGAAADNRNAESSVIVMADKFEVVKNAQDGQPVRLFGVAQNKVAINGDLIATGTIKGSHIDADSVRAGILTAGAIRTEHLAAGQISADKLAIGLGGNLLYNPIFSNPTDGIPYGWSRWQSDQANNIRYSSINTVETWSLAEYLPNEYMLRFAIDRGSATTSSTSTAVIENNWYMGSVWLATHRGRVWVSLRFHKPDGTYNDYSSESVINGYSMNGGLKSAKRVSIKAKAPVGAVKVSMLIWLVSLDGQTNSICYAARPMIEECTEYATEPSAWVNAGVTSIHGGSIVTNTVTAQQIAANTITANEIAAGTIAARNMAANSIEARHIVGSSITADKLNVNNLAAISANLGAITAGSININNRFKVSNTGVVEMRANSGNVGMVMNNDSIIVYDEQGRVRIKIGKL